MSARDKLSYLQGLLDGMKIEENSPYGQVFQAIAGVLDEAVDELEDVGEDIEELEELVDEISGDLEAVEDALEDLADSLDYEEDDEDDEDDDDDDEGLMEFECEHCHRRIIYDVESFNMEDEHLCPMCGKPLFTEEAEEEE